MFKFLILTLALPLIWASPALAYIDPGVSSMLLQALAAGAMAVAVFWRNCVNFVKKLLSKQPPTAKPGETPPTDC